MCKFQEVKKVGKAGKEVRTFSLRSTQGQRKQQHRNKEHVENWSTPPSPGSSKPSESTASL